MTSLQIRRLIGDPILIDDAERAALDFFRRNPQMRPFDDRAGGSPSDRLVIDDIRAINSHSMGARASYAAWAGSYDGPHDWLASLSLSWDLVDLSDDAWNTEGRPALERAFLAITAKGRGLAGVSKLLYWKRPALMPMLDSVVMSQLLPPKGKSFISAVGIVDHLRAEGRRNLPQLEEVRSHLLQEGYDRTIVRVIDALIWASA